MLPYFVVLLLICGAAVVTLWRPDLINPLSIVVVAVLVLFAGLRFETGYDWPVYEGVLKGTPDIWGVLNGERQSGRPVTVEPIYSLLLSFIKSSGGGLQAAFLIGALFCIPAVAAVIYRIAPSAVLPVLAVHFGLTFLPAHMAAERQTFASALILLSLVLRCEGRSIAAVAVYALAFGFHSSALMFLPVVAFAPLQMRWASVSVLVCIGLIVVGAQIDVLSPVAEFARAANLGPIAVKIKEYVTPVGYSPVNLIFTAGELCVLLVYYFGTTWQERDNRFVRAGFWLTVLLVLAQLFLPGNPVFWKRIMIVALPWQLATLWSLAIFRRLPLEWKAAVVAGASIASAAVLFFYLRQSVSTVYLPYNSVLQVAVTGEHGNGRERWEAMIKEVGARYQP